MKTMMSVLAVVSLALSAILPAQQALAAPPSGAAPATIITATLDRVPIYGVDVRFAVPPGGGWSEVNTGDQVLLERLHLSFTPDAKILKAWRALDQSPDRTYPEQPYIYVYGTAIPLDNHTNVKTPEDLAQMALASFCDAHTMCNATPAESIPVGDVPAVAYSVRDAHTFSEDTDLTGYIADYAGGGESITQGLECRSEQVFAVAGNWGYQFVMITTQPKALSNRLGDLKEMLTGLAFTYQPAAAAPAPAPAAPAPAAPAPVAPAPVAAVPGVISHVPVVGPNGDLQFDLPAALGWRHTDMAGNLNGLVPLDLLQGEYQLAAERALVSQFGGAYIYFVATATSLDARPDIKTADDLAQAKFAFASKHRAAFRASEGTNGMVAGIPARMYRTTERYELNDQAVDINEITGSFGESRTATEVTWTTERAIAVGGNWAYEFRLMSTDEGALNTRMGDFDTLLSTVSFKTQPAAAPAAPVAPAAPAPAAPAPAAAAAAAAGVISHVPVVDANGDLQFDLPAAKGWTHADSVSRLAGILPTDLLPGEYQISAIERVPVSQYGGAYIYFVATATSLDARPDIKTADDLAQAKFAFAGKHLDGFQAETGANGTVGGTPARMYRTTERYEWPADAPVDVEEITGYFGESRTATEVTWTTQRAFAVHGNWAYEFRLTSTDEGALATRMPDFETLLSTVTFKY